MDTSTIFTVSPSSQVGDVYATPFTLVADVPSSFNKFAWDFGDKTFFYNVSAVEHTYNYPGVYKVSLSAWNDLGDSLVDRADINVDYIFRDAIAYTQIPGEYGIPGRRTTIPFTVSLTSAKIDEPISLVLQSLGTKSVPHYAVPDKWSFLTPRWRFVNADTSQTVDGPLEIKTTPVYVNSRVVAVTGEVSFYYVDDLSTGIDLSDTCPLMLVATLSTEHFVYPPESLVYPYYSYSNSEVARAVIAWQVNDVIPTALAVTENFISDVYPVKWTNVPIPVMVTCRFDPTRISTFVSSNLSATGVLAYPRTNELGAVSAVNVVVLSGDGTAIPRDYYSLDDPSLYFKATDDGGNITSGYIFTSITPLSPVDTSLYIAVSTVTTNQRPPDGYFMMPDGYPIYPSVYVAHPYGSSINKINVVTYPSNCDQINYYKNLGLLVDGVISYVSAPTLSSVDLANYTLSGTAAIYGLAFNPVQNKLYAADADQDRLYIYDGGEILSKTVEISAITSDSNNSPSYISTDSQSNVWVSLYSHQRLLKFDPNLNFLLSAVPSVTIPLETTDDSPGGGTGNPVIAPPVVETDKDDNVWACYGHALSSMLVKFDSLGNELLQATALEVSSVPVSLAINPNNDVWVACYQSNKLECYSSEGALVSSVDSFLHPSYIAIDRAGNVWVLHAYNYCSVYDTRSHAVSSWKFNGLLKTVVASTGYTPEDIALTSGPPRENEIWGGLAVDVFNRVWAVDSENNVIFGFNANDPLHARVVPAIPHTTTNYVYKSSDPFISEVDSLYLRSAQAAGDWTGNRWYQKYTGGFGTLPVSGISTGFKVYDPYSTDNIAKVSETFDTAAYFKSLALPEILSKNTELFDTFLAAVVGDSDPTKESLGRVAYERTANFIQTHGDFQTAEIDQLLAFAEELSVQGKTFGVEFPAEISRLLNLFSVPKHLLRGQPSYSLVPEDNIGVLLTESATISADQYLFCRDTHFLTPYQLVHVAPLSTTGGFLTTYPLASIQVDGLREPITSNYYFFEYLPSQIGWSGNIIDWDSSYTTIDYTLSSNDEWYGDGGLVEIMFNNLLTKRLFLE